ncbi:MAG: protein YgfX [Burkholderiales bacterium]
MSIRRLRLELAPSAPLAAAILASHAAAALCLAALLPGAAGLGAAALVVLAGAQSTRKRALLRGRAAVRALEVGGAEGPQVRLGNGESFPAELAERRYVGRHMVVLCLRRPVRRTILVTRDMVDAQLFRRLRIWALWGKLPIVATKQLPA